MGIVVGCVFGFSAWFIVRYLIAGFYTIDQNQRAVITSFGRAQRLGDATTLDDPISETLVKDESGPFCFGAAPTLADLCLVPQLANARRFGVDVSAYPRLLKAEAAAKALPAFANAAPEKQPDAE